MAEFRQDPNDPAHQCKFVKLSVEFPPHALDRVRAAAESMHLSMFGVIRRAVYEFCNRFERENSCKEA